MEVKLLVAYCKRKGGLILAEKSDPDFNRERLELVFNETAADLRSLDIECAALVETSEVLPAATVSVLYDCLYDFAALRPQWIPATKPPVLVLDRYNKSGVFHRYIRCQTLYKFCCIHEVVGFMLQCLFQRLKGAALYLRL